MGDGEKLLTHLNSALKALLGLDIFPRVPKKKVKFCWQVLLTVAESDVPVAELNAGSSLSPGAGQMNVAVGNVWHPAASTHVQNITRDDPVTESLKYPGGCR